MNLNSINVDEELKRSTLEKAKQGKTVNKAVYKKTLGIIAACLVLTVGVSALFVGTGIKNEADTSSDEATDEGFNNSDFSEINEADGLKLYSADGYFADAYGYSDYADDFTADETSGTAIGDNSQQNSVHLTGARINDNENFASWKEQIEKYPDGLFENGYSVFGLSTDKRTAVKVTDGDGNAVCDATVKLIDSQGNTVYTAKSDKNGNAYLFSASKKNGGGLAAVRVSATSGNAECSQELNENDETVTLVLEKGTQLVAPSAVDVMFLIDTTGSMSDELSYLTSELGTLAEKVGKDARFSVNFYRDEGDAYVTKTNDFTDAAGATALLSAESADGGGDTPEAVDKILEKACGEYSWRDNSAKICFLVLDAQAHSEQQAVLTRIAQAVDYFAENGIRIVPVMGSGADNETEIMCRQFALLTGGQFVFLTDNSGIGDAHKAPETDVEYDVKALIDVLTDVINDYV